jgi:hypothetical protein
MFPNYTSIWHFKGVEREVLKDESFTVMQAPIYCSIVSVIRLVGQSVDQQARVLNNHSLSL